MGFSKLLQSGLSGLGRGLMDASGSAIATGYRQAQSGLNWPSQLDALQEHIHGPAVDREIHTAIARAQRQADEAASGLKSGPYSSYNGPYSY
ncbi:MAG: hypothetical protein OJF50_006277 [Nitrospira sp.]|jgi:hypothetical protein|nr:hypothetical protein [Nitrospira sp.]